VLKGPTAAALYGSRAGNGVIMVTTKKGGKNGRIGINYTGKFTVSKVAYSLDEQDTYGQGSNGQFVSSSDLSWGAKMTGQSIPAWWDKSQTTTYEVQKDVMKNFYRDGGVQSNAVSFQGGDKDNPFRITLSHDYTKGNVRYNSITRTDFDVVSHYKLTDFLSFDVKADYTNTKGLNRPTLGLYGSTYYLYTMPRSIQLSDLSTYKFNPTDLAAGKTEAMNWFGPDENNQNPYFILEQWKNKDTKNRLFGYAAANVKLTPDLTFKLKQGLDIADTQYRYIYPFDDVVFGNYPASEMSKYTSKEMNTEFLLSYNKVFGDFQVGVSAGGNRMYSKTEGLIGKSGKMNIYGSHYLTLGTKPYVENTLYEKEINSLYAFANIGYKDFIYLDLTARNDWSSTLPSGKRSYFYPSASLSVLVTSWMDEMGINYNKKMINYGKIRASFAQVGKDTDPYQLLNTYGTTTDDAFGYLYTNEPTTLANTTLKPEIATSWELGTEWRLFNNRFGFDFTYYNTATKNQVVAVDLPITSGSGWASKYLNIGKITNKGVELAMNGTVIRTNDMSLELTANIAHNKTKLVKLAEGVAYHKFDELNSTGSAMQLRAYPHGTFGEIYDYGFVRDDKGNIVVDAEGYPEKSGDLVKLGDIQPDFTGSFGLNYNYKGFNLSALFNFQKGGDIFSFTECEAARFGIAKCTENRESFVFDGVTESGAKNTTAITDVQKYWTNVPAEQFMHDASFLKLKELSLGYTFSKSFLNKYTNNIINSLKLSVFGSNLFYLVKHTPGTTPDNSAFSATVFAQAVDYAPLPNTRTFGLSVNVGF
jgi:TonB-linked SusC/RagA family outer membrane protein